MSSSNRGRTSGQRKADLRASIDEEIEDLWERSESLEQVIAEELARNSIVEARRMDVAGGRTAVAERSETTSLKATSRQTRVIPILWLPTPERLQ